MAPLQLIPPGAKIKALLTVFIATVVLLGISAFRYANDPIKKVDVCIEQIAVPEQNQEQTLPIQIEKHIDMCAKWLKAYKYTVAEVEIIPIQSDYGSTTSVLVHVHGIKY